MTENEKKADLLLCLELVKQAFYLCNRANVILSKEFNFFEKGFEYRKHIFYDLWMMQPQHEIYALEQKIKQVYNKINPLKTNL